MPSTASTVNCSSLCDALWDNITVTQHARFVLEDCKGALAELRDGVQGPEWRRRFAAAVALLRAVGHVLKNVDSDVSPEAKAAIEAEWQALNSTKPDPKDPYTCTCYAHIFWSFIEKERNNILKEYRFNAGQSVTVPIPSGVTTYSYPMNSEPLAGPDQREVIRKAIQFWEDYLDRVDERIADCSDPERRR